MSTQPSLFTEKRTIQQRFEEFHSKNPRVFDKLLELARVVKATNRPKFAIGCLWERLRWYEKIERTDQCGEAFELNDHFRSRYVRLLIERYPEFDGVFELRKLRTA